MKKKLQKIICSSLLSLALIGSFGGMVNAASSSPKSHIAYRYVWGCVAETEWNCKHYTRVWISPLGTDSGRVWGKGHTKAVAYGDAITGTAQSRYGR